MSKPDWDKIQALAKELYTKLEVLQEYEDAKPDTTERPKAKVILFKPSGKYYTEEEWRIPTEEEARKFSAFSPGDMVTPYCMYYSPDFHRIGDNLYGGRVLVVTQEPWGYPHLL